MTLQTPPSEKTEIIYPSSDGQPMADSTIQYQWIIKIQVCENWRYFLS